jgi:uncharacterized HhH-GPD family protein
VTLHLSQDADADALLTRDPFALLVGMVLDQQVPLEWAFAAPFELQRRLGRPLDPAGIAAMDPEALASIFAAKPALHRYPGSMAARVHELSRIVTERYGGDVTTIWRDAVSGAELLGRIKELPGFGEQKSKIFVALLGKQLGVRPEGWRQVSAPFGDAGSFRSVADITGPDTLLKVRAVKAEHKKMAATAGKRSTPAEAATKRATKTAVAKKAVAEKAAAKKTAGAAKKAVAKKTAGAAKKVGTARAATKGKAAGRAATR